MRFDYTGNEYYSGGVARHDRYEVSLPAPPRAEAPPPAPEEKRRGKRRAPRVIALLLVCALVGGGAGYAARWLPGGARSAVPAISQLLVGDSRGGEVTGVQKTKVAGQEMTYTEIYAACVSSTVGIATEITTNIFGQTTRSAAAGSGFILTADGYILTNYHVIDGASTIRADLYDGRSYTAALVGGDKDTDIAVLKIDAADLQPAVIGSSSALLVGEPVCAIGNPLGELTFTLTTGVVSALGRSITTRDGVNSNMIQTNCAVNSGNSGGPLLNSRGEVIGIVSAKYASSGVEGLGFAIPVSDVLDMITDLMEHGYITGKAYMGITVTTAGLQEGRQDGAQVSSVTPGSCSEKAGLRQGDIIISMNGKPVSTKEDLISLKNDCRAGDTAQLIVLRDGQTITLSLTFDEQTPELEAANTLPETATETPYGGSPYFFWGSPRSGVS